jgi:hypothetical protein
MAKCFSSWTVLPHDPIEKVADNLWRVQGTMNDGKLQRQMVLGRMRDGRIVIHNGIALDDAGMKEIEAWGKPAVLFVPNSFHRQDAGIWKQRYPELTVVAPKGARKRVEKIVKVDAITEDAPHDDTVRLRPLDGCPGESVLEVRSGDDVTAVFTDAILNMRKQGGPFGFVLAPTGKISAPRVARWMLIKDKKAFTAQLDALAATPGLRRLMFAHGKPAVGAEAAEGLRAVSAQLRA